MACSFVNGDSWNGLNGAARWGAASTAPPGQMMPQSFAESATLRCRVSGATDFGERRPLNMQFTPQSNITAAPWASEKKSGSFANASQRQLHIFRLDGDGCPQLKYKKAGGNGRPLSTSCRRAGRQTPAPSPSKFELAAVAALCSPAASTSRALFPRVGPTKRSPFPSAHSFVPSRNIFLGKTPSEEGDARPEGASSIPLLPTRSFDEAAKKDPSGEAFTSLTGLSCQTLTQPPTAHWENVVPRTGGGDWQGMGTFQQLPGGPESSISRCFIPRTCCSPNVQWRDQLLQGTQHVESNRNAHMSMSHQLHGAPSQAAGTANCSFASQPLPGVALTKASSCGENAMLPHIGLNELNSPVVQAAAALGCSPRNLSHLIKPLHTTCRKNGENAQEHVDDQRAEVVTVYGTERFWDLMETLAELQRGPTSLLSSSVTFDSVLLPGGELEYSIIQQGSFGKVFVGTYQGSKVAIKVPVECMLTTDPAGVVERTLNEWKILSMCQHPNVVRLIGGIVHGPFDVWLVTQLANGSDLHSRKYSRDPLVRRFISPENGLYMCRQLAAVVAYLHVPVPGRKPIVVHRDIKPENVLIGDDWTIQLCDFGDAEASADGRVSRISGATWFYAPAELLRCSPVECMASRTTVQLPPLNEKWDIWSMGCVFQEMFGFLSPMHVHISNRDSPNVIYEKLKSKAISGTLVPDIASGIQGIARNIIARCLDPDPSSRPSAVEVLNMWNARDEDILKDIHMRPYPPEAKAVEAPSFNSSNREGFPRITAEPQQMLPRICSLRTEPNRHFITENTRGEIRNIQNGQPCSSASAYSTHTYVNRFS